jgi:biopolymer transport protein ExbB/TolQ
MNVGALLESVIYLISASMLYPAMILLTGGFVIMVISLGAFIAEWAQRSFEKSPDSGEHGSSSEPKIYNSGTALQKLDDILNKEGSTWEEVDNLWRHVTLERWKKLDYLRILAKLGPAMGLVGTLIPMSTGLASLSQGDTSRLSSDLVVAFSTTVVGLCTGVAAFVLFTVRSRWLEGDIAALQLVFESRANRVLEDDGHGTQV